MSDDDSAQFTIGMAPLPSYTDAMKYAGLSIAMLLFGSLSTTRIGAQESAAPAALQKRFEVAALKLSAPDNRETSWSVRANTITISNYTLRRMIRIAYNLKSNTQVLGGPDWIDKVHYDISAKIDDSDLAKFKDMSPEKYKHQMQLMIQSFLAERFQLEVSNGERKLPVYLLVTNKSGAKLKEIPPAINESEAKSRDHSMSTSNGHLIAKAISMDSFADSLTSLPDTGDRIVVNQTGLSGEFDFSLNWAEDRGGGIPIDAPLPGLFTALPEQLGLALKSGESQIPVVEIQAVSKPQLD